MTRRAAPQRFIRLLLLAGILALSLPSGDAVAQAAPNQSEPTGMLQITASQPGAQVWVDHELVGDAPVSKYLSPGEHTIRVSADGFDPFVRKVRVRAGTRAAVAAPLSPGGGTVEFQVNVPGGQVSLDGRPPSSLPIRLRALKPGTHRYQLNAPGHEPSQGTFDFKSGINIFVFEELESASGRFVVTSEPAGATVTLDGNDVGQTPLSLEGIEPGVHLVRIDDGKRPAVFETVDTTDGSKGEVGVKLGKKGAAIVINTGSAEGAVRMGGVLLGTGRKVPLGKMAKGRYIVEVMAPDTKPASGKVTVPPAGRKAYRANMVPTDGKGRSRLEEQRPFYLHWAFWTAVGVGVSGATTGAIVAAQGNQPVPIPDGDVTVSLP